MLSRLLTSGVRRSTCLQSLQSLRSVSISARLLAGGGHHHIPTPEPHVPKPLVEGERDWFGRSKVPRVTQDTHEHTSEDYFSYVGGGVFVLLTVAAVAFYTDLFGMNIKKNFKHLHHKSFVKSEKESEPTQQSAHESKLPDFVPYLIVGSGAAGYYASLAIRARDADAKVLIVGEEKELPYNRPPLSKELWWYGDEKSGETLEYKGLNGKKRDVFFESQGFFVPTSELSKVEHGGVALVSGTRVTKIDTASRTAHLDDGRKVKYGKCLLATGAQPKKVDVFSTVSDHTNYMKTISDYRRLNEACARGGTVAVVGGGILASEMAYSIKRRYPGTRVVHIIREAGPLCAILPSFLSAHARKGLESTGVEERVNATVQKAEAIDGGRVRLSLAPSSPPTTEPNTTLLVDYVIVDEGFEPDVSLADRDSIKVDSSNGGFRADARLCIGPSEWCAGDACAYDAGVLGRRRVEHWENAQITGRLAGENMTGGERDYWYQPSYFTKVGPEMHVNAVGKTDSTLNTVSIFAQQTADFPNRYHKGVVFYTENERIVGCLLVNVFGSGLDIARRLIDERRAVGEAKELAKLFALWEVEKEGTEAHDDKKSIDAPIGGGAPGDQKSA